MIFPDIFILDQFCWSKLLSMGNLLTAFSLFHCLKRGTDLQPCFVSNLGGFTEMLPETTVVHPGILAPLNEFKKNQRIQNPLEIPPLLVQLPQPSAASASWGEPWIRWEDHIYIHIYIFYMSYIGYPRYWIMVYIQCIYIYSILDMQPGDYDL